MLSDAEASLAYVQVVKVAGVSLWALFREKKVTLPKFIVLHKDNMMCTSASVPYSAPNLWHRSSAELRELYDAQEKPRN